MKFLTFIHCLVVLSIFSFSQIQAAQPNEKGSTSTADGQSAVGGGATVAAMVGAAVKQPEKSLGECLTLFAQLTEQPVDMKLPADSAFSRILIAYDDVMKLYGWKILELKIPYNQTVFEQRGQVNLIRAAKDNTLKHVNALLIYLTVLKAEYDRVLRLEGDALAGECATLAEKLQNPLYSDMYLDFCQPGFAKKRVHKKNASF